MGALAIVWLALPSLALVSTGIALGLGWPRAHLEGTARGRLAVIAALGLAELAPWAFALAAPSAVLQTHEARTDFVVETGMVVACAAMLGTLALARALEPSPRRRALGWLVAHALFLATYLTDVGRAGVGQIL